MSPPEPIWKLLHCSGKLENATEELPAMAFDKKSQRYSLRPGKRQARGSYGKGRRELGGSLVGRETGTEASGTEFRCLVLTENKRPHRGHGVGWEHACKLRAHAEE